MVVGRGRKGADSEDFGVEGGIVFRVIRVWVVEKVVIENDV